MKKPYKYNPMPAKEYHQKRKETEAAKNAAQDRYKEAHREYNHQVRNAGPDKAASPAVQEAAAAQSAALKSWREAVAAYYAIIDQRPRHLRG